MAQIKRPSQICLIGDVGRPKSGAPATANTASPSDNGYYSDAGMKQPGPVVSPIGWTASSADKEAACRHNNRAILTLLDGHSESLKLLDLATDANDVFAINSD